jgi:hypothetical protein
MTALPGAGRTPVRPELRALRLLHFQYCSATAVQALEGPAQQDGAPSYAAYLCPDHVGQGLDGFPGTAVDSSEGMGCGTVTDFRDFGTIVRSHADQWLGPLFDAHPDDHGHSWAAALRWAVARCEVLAATPPGERRSARSWRCWTWPSGTPAAAMSACWRPR